MKQKNLCPEWIADLQVGDVVCDCRGRHIRVIALEEELYPLHSSKIRKFCRQKFIPSFIETFVLKLWTPICDLFEWDELWDKQLELSDGAFCSARNCCAPANHEHKEDCIIVDDAIATVTHTSSS